MKKLIITSIFIALFISIGAHAYAEEERRDMQFYVSGFEEGQSIPAVYTCSGRNISPELVWKKAPKGTKSFALVMDDPDAPSGIWVHWVVYNIPSKTQGLPENIDAAPQLQDGTLQGRNDFRKIGYGGPCPPQGHGVHRYFFKLYALDSLLDLQSGASKAELEKAMEGHVLETAVFMGKYGR